MSTLDDVNAASGNLYGALNSMADGNATPMASAWAKRGAISAQHPIGGRDDGYIDVIASFTKFAEIVGGGEIRLEDQIIDAGFDLAVETGVEIGKMTVAGQEVSIQQRVTNVYRKEDGSWKIAHHHTDLSVDMLQIIQRLTEAA